jgi:NNP family nitrate/nitrite transporter-like MFS transporter
MTIQTVEGTMGLDIGLGPVLFTVLLFVVGVAMAIGKASVFKFISDDFTDNIGAVSGVVGLAGGLGGFILPIMFGAVVDLTGVRSSSFMLLYGTVCVSLVWMHFSFKPGRQDTLAAQAAPLKRAA